ncbi:MAG: DoxX family membrane protein [Terriglobia bacterium]
MNIAFLIGRLIFGGYFISAGINHFKNLNYMSGYVKSKGAPAPKAAVAGTGVLLLLGGLSMFLGVLPLAGVILLIIFLLGASPQMHAFWKIQEPQARAMEKINFMKNMALLGALLMFLAIPTPWPFRW